MGSAFLMLGIGLLGVALSVWVAVERLPGISAPAQGVIAWYMFTMFSWDARGLRAHGTRSSSSPARAA